MTEELIKFQFSTTSSSIIKVIGVGGGGCNAVNHMFEAGIKDVDYIVCNTDAQALENSPVPIKIQLGATLTEGRGAGNRPEMGEEAARENYDEIRSMLEFNTKMVFITAGMGGGTGTGAAPIIARVAREMGILTIAVVTIPAPSEGRKRHTQAMEGIKKLSDFVDSMLVVSNKRLHHIYGDLPARQAFKLADDIVKTAVKGVAEIITLHGNINIDFADVFTVMSKSKVFIMGTGYASGENRAMNAVQMALRSPLLDNTDIKGTKNILLNIISGTNEITIGEIGEIIEYLQKQAGDEADIIWGNGYDTDIGENISVTILCTGFSHQPTYLTEEAPVEQFTLFDPEPAKKEATTGANISTAKTVELEVEPVIPVKPEPPRKHAHQPAAAGQPVRREVRNRPRQETTKKPQETNVENWFYRKFGRLFDDDDQAI